jgi:hypothetical protein
LDVLAKVSVQDRCNNALKHYGAAVLISWSADVTNYSFTVCPDRRQHLEHGEQGITDTLLCSL